MEELIKTLEEINWDFSDYNSSKYPLDLNSIPWYPATFIPPIPRFLIALLTQPGEVVLDPFGGKGTTAIEAIKQNRIPITNDLNPFASEYVNAAFYAIHFSLENVAFSCLEDAKLEEFRIPPDGVDVYIDNHNINTDVSLWYHPDTLSELLTIVNLMLSEKKENEKLFLVRKLAFSSILKQASSQSGHVTYVTDNCKPKPEQLVYKNAKKLFQDKAQQLALATQELISQFSITNPNNTLSSLLENVKVVTGDARKLNWIKEKSVNLVLTSPPYLCAQDYIKTMRLTNLFFPNHEGFLETAKLEIGPRNKRRGKADIVVPEFYSDMNLVFAEVARVLKPDGYFCLIIGQGKAKITQEYDTISDLCKDIVEQHKLKKIFHTTRKISNRVIQVGGVSTEDIIIFRNTEK